ncbi:O-antigen ligase family protein [Carboxydochorda subterranea]|uniref:O-antigen ligase family protein n=1 Tax=Carboxydichorda subterranea TaxID=3109565 RepID=A0ABZ1C1L7_9FIRM|nr:O-antigen ligase family protein [Limnochorda sp. L945t]WRP18844.1 O-antigen ligase family protein [Limnochorda sp. L945t]
MGGYVSSAGQNRWLWAMVLVHVFLTPFFFEFDNLPFRLTTTDLLAALIVLLWLTNRIRRQPGRASPPLLFPTLLFVGAHFLAILPATDRVVALREAVKIAGIFAVFFAVADTVRTADQRRTLAWVLTLAGAIVSGLAIVEAFRGPAGWSYAGTRPVVTMGSPNTVGAYLASIFPVSLSLLYQAILERSRLGARATIGLSLALMAIALAVSLSRGSWISLLVALPIVVVVLAGHRDGRAVLIGTLIALVATGVVVGAVLLARSGPGSNVLHTLTRRAVSIVSLDSAGDRVRWMMLRASWAMFLDNPWLGVGPGNFQSRLPAYIRPTGSVEKQLVPLALELEFPHNLPLHVAAEGGIVGLASLAVWVTSMFIQYARRLHEARRWVTKEALTNNLLTAGGFAGVVAALVGSLFGYPFVHHVWEPFVYAMVLGVAEPPAAEVPVRGTTQGIGSTASTSSELQGGGLPS